MKVYWSTWHAWDKEKIWVPDRNWTHDLLYTGRVLYPLSYKNSWRARSFNWVHVWQASCILLGSALEVIVSHRAPAQCSRGPGLDSCPMLMSCWSVHLSHFITELKIHHLYSLVTTIERSVKNMQRGEKSGKSSTLAWNVIKYLRNIGLVTYISIGNVLVQTCSSNATTAKKFLPIFVLAKNWKI